MTSTHVLACVQPSIKWEDKVRAMPYVPCIVSEWSIERLGTEHHAVFTFNTDYLHEFQHIPTFSLLGAATLAILISGTKLPARAWPDR
jgi:hypothetical protein